MTTESAATPTRIAPLPPTPRAVASAHWRTFAIALVTGLAVFVYMSHSRARSPEAVARVRELQPLPPSPTSPLQHVIDVVDLNNIPLEKAIDWLADQGGVNIVPQWQAIESGGIDRNAPVSLHLKHVKTRQALVALMVTIEDLDRPMAKLDWMEHDGIVVISTSDALGGHDTVVRAYDIRDLLQDASIVQNDLTPAMPADPTTAPAVTPPTEDDLVDRMKSIITSNVRPDSWRDNGGTDGSCTYWAGQLIIVQTDAGQREVEAFLELLRRRD